MKMLFVLRHAKAEPAASGSDFSRALTERGEEDAAHSGKHIAKIATPDLIVTSDAERALSTARIVAKKTEYNAEIVQNPAIYEARVEVLIDVVRTFPNSADIVVLVGHNPGLEGLVYALGENRESVPRLATATFVQMAFDVDDWSDVTDECGRIAGSYTP